MRRDVPIGYCPVMFAEPTIDDFRQWIDSRLDRAAEAAERAIRASVSHANAAGRYRSGSTVVTVFAEARHGLDAGIDAALARLKRELGIARLNPEQMREVTEARLRAFLERVKLAVEPPKLRQFASPKLVDEQLAQLDRNLDFKLRQFDVGLFDPAEHEGPAVMSNSISIGTMTNGAIQQGNTDLAQHVIFRLEPDAIQCAIDALERGLADSHVSADDRATIMADIATIKAQLSKPSPSATILQEAGRTIRSVAESIVGGVLTPAFLAAVAALAAALWLG